MKQAKNMLDDCRVVTGKLHDPREIPVNQRPPIK